MRQRKYERRQVKGLKFRQGPSSIEDAKLLAGNEILDDDAPKGLNDYLPVPDKLANIRDIAGSEVLIVYFAKLGLSKKCDIDLDYLETLINAGANVNYTDRHGQTVLHEVRRRFIRDVFCDFGPSTPLKNFKKTNEGVLIFVK